MKERLALAGTARGVARAAIGRDLPQVPADGIPAFDLPRVFFWNSPPHVVPAIPLEPAARVVTVNPALSAPFGERLACVHFEMIELGVALAFARLARRKLGFREPRFREFLGAVAHVDAAEDADGEHLGWSQIRPEIRREILSGRFGQFVFVTLLHQVIDDNTFFHRLILAFFQCVKIIRLIV